MKSSKFWCLRWTDGFSKWSKPCHLWRPNVFSQHWNSDPLPLSGIRPTWNKSPFRQAWWSISLPPFSTILWKLSKTTHISLALCRILNLNLRWRSWNSLRKTNLGDAYRVNNELTSLPKLNCIHYTQACMKNQFVKIESTTHTHTLLIICTYKRIPYNNI